MPAKPGASARLTDEHRGRVAAGLASVAEVAAELGMSRQAAHRAFKRRGWPTAPAVAENGGAKAPQRLEEAQEASSATKVAGPAGGASKAASGAANGHSEIGALFPTADAEEALDDFLATIRLDVANTALLGLAQARALLAGNRLSPQGLKAIMAAAGLALDQLARAGYDLASPASAAAPKVIFEEITADEFARIREQANREYLGEIDPEHEHDAP